MNVTVFGATGRTGRAFLTAAARAGHRITAQVREPARLGHAPVDRVVTGSPFDESAVTDALTGADAAVVAFGLKGNRTTPLYSRGTELIVDAMGKLGVRRLIVVSEAGYGSHVRGASGRVIAVLYRTTARPLLREREAQDAVVLTSGLDWTVVRSGALHHGPSRGNRPRSFVPRRGLAPRTTYADLADLVLGALDDPSTYGRDLYP
ncbi:NAD(P)H-binding protein [Streptomyces sp. NBC_01498]|uniref:NAD(P)-dependent oxidoreductase n=1 Tax=Streptomyces sp. NBC_01498 TaxID=2975870 RepID=UPI002E7BA46B|nr:NAD(P)-binding oxidoreductase [Streptomyces sp. NBC_01498]WTL24487.1 NAD(P)H-binding protein [Streptomyces sp. NBC_01498]